MDSQGLDVVLADQANTRLGVRQRDAFPVVDDPRANGRHVLERRMRSVE